MLSSGLVLVPFAAVSLPPATDLPQHECQVFLFLQALRHENLLTIQWCAPNTLVYIPLLLLRLLTSPQRSGRVTLALLALGWNGAHFLAARRRAVAPENAFLAALLIFNFALYWGFLNFLVGWPFFLLWLVELERPPDRRNRVVLLVLALLLYMSHILWLIMAGLCLAVRTARAWDGRKAAWHRWSALAPTGLATLIVYPSFATARGSGFDLAPHWVHAPLARFSPGALVNSLFGGLRGDLEPILVVAIGAWLVASLVTNRRTLRRKIDRALLRSAGVLVAVSAFAPDEYFNTLSFAQRWMPVAAILVILALPRPRLPRPLPTAAPLLLLAALSIGSARAWSNWQREEMSGLTQALGALPERQKVLGLDYVKESAYLKGRPFLQSFAYAQAWKGAEVNFSFAELASGLVRDSTPRIHAWTVGLEWFPERVTAGDIEQFDYLLVNGTEREHRTILGDPIVSLVTGTGPWRLYRVSR